MPELPEVEVVRAGLERHVVGATVTAVEVLHDRPVRRHPSGSSGFAAELTGRTLLGARRRGKYLWLPLDSGDALMAHLGMSGQLLVQPVGHPDERHLRVRLTLAPTVSAGVPGVPVPAAESGAASVAPDPTPALELRFVDQRMFGGLALSPGGAELPPEIAHIARDPLDPEFDEVAFSRRVRRSGSGIKRLLLTQTVISGVGNIYADEALWRARLHGDRAGRRLTHTQVLDLLGQARAVMTDALDEGGTSFDALYVNVNGESGYFDRSLHAYGRVDEPCDRCGSPIRRVAFMNRSSYFCPVCQPVPRRTPRRGQAVRQRSD
ncbi:bifunctional DNA-formamidopyrimidine glycosylase/DNA-(apurinic or apyrimidinic site) lyase [Nocardioides insulae]|uniref:bifunctional DNA-formamidopyrimidine glycosylase/DNA-(apurinic or apyrimidinic site) lyase n=1 Tax=Nocardioides insulae TaxID=394734 RepID=UPI00041D19BA|nr:bifunctional DNA-formamidopyrimidine glycosylase/DNA-(apurinic or apyrimidinic site) lyase [Nocardioides insulae]